VLVYTNGLIIIASIEANPRRTGGRSYLIIMRTRVDGMVTQQGVAGVAHHRG